MAKTGKGRVWKTTGSGHRTPGKKGGEAEAKHQSERVLTFRLEGS